MRFGLTVALAVGAMMLLGRSAEAQARGALQASATVVDTHQGFAALSAVRQTLASMTVRQPTITSVAQISTAHPATDPSTVVVTVDYSRN